MFQTNLLGSKSKPPSYIFYELAHNQNLIVILIVIRRTSLMTILVIRASSRRNYHISTSAAVKVSILMEPFVVHIPSNLCEKGGL